MYDWSRRLLYYQVGLPYAGVSSLTGDYERFRLPETDDSIAGLGSINYNNPLWAQKFRPVFRDNDRSVATYQATYLSPNIASRLAGTFGLAYRVLQNRNRPFADQLLVQGNMLYLTAARAGPIKGRLFTTEPPTLYPETTWRDDLMFATAELCLATASAPLPLPRNAASLQNLFMNAVVWGNLYVIRGDNMKPISVADLFGLNFIDLARALELQGVNTVGLNFNPATLWAQMRKRLNFFANNSVYDPFFSGYADDYAVAARVAAIGVEAALFSRITPDAQERTRFRALAERQRDWLLGANAWGMSFFVGAGTIYPRCMHHMIANLATGGPTPLRGALVGGPANRYKVDNANLTLRPGAQSCSVDLYRQFSNEKLAFRDHVMAAANTEPKIDASALALYLISLLA
eukprot:CAMPEP_0184661038 /NCGR_PEP_ID=MMETSP0308-20130426/36704_1 /TAXON_ID=38269 /ORGANISM="Gloeochaete witrockiana, Strain SAG 46.84" /LENGTH=403 /DNA_ID=CAMNT_0027102071 /DNA_START=865 /DNA_END=2076 /DNA_ORIENTATION=+